MALDLMMANGRIKKSDISRFIREVRELADAYDAIANLQSIQVAGMKQSQDIFNLVEQMHKLNRTDQQPE